jgi:hypothetical protein
MYPDIEVYIKGKTEEEIVQWLKDQFGAAEYQGKLQGGLLHYDVTNKSDTLPVMIMPAVVGKAWTSVWYDSPNTPWQDDVTCAQQMAKELNTEARCIRSGWDEDQEPDEWLKISADGSVEEILWKK